MASKRRQRRMAQRREHEATQNITKTLGASLLMKDGEMGRSQSFADVILGRVHNLSGKPVLTEKPAPVAGLEMPMPKLPASSVLVPPANKDTETLIKQSHDQKSLIWKMAQENQDYYILMQMEDKSGPKPWFMYPKFPYQYSEFVMLNAEMSKTMLDHLWAKDEGNRNKKPTLVDAYKRDIQNDRWIPTDEAIGINLSFEVYNGQHRCWAIFECGKPMPMYITWNVLDEAKFFIESGAIRTLAERLKMVTETKLGNRTSGFCKAIMRGLTPRLKYTNADVAEFSIKWNSLIGWVSQHLPIARAEVQAAVAKAYLWHGPELIEPFCHRLRNIRFPEDGDPAKALYTSLQNAKQNRINQSLMAYKKTLQALDALVNKRPLSKLYERESDIFQWLPGWEVPPKPQK